MNLPPHIQQICAEMLKAAPTHERRAVAAAVQAVCDIARQIRRNPMALVMEPEKSIDCNKAVQAQVAKQLEGWTREQLSEYTARVLSGIIVSKMVPILSAFRLAGGDVEQLLQGFEKITAEVIKDK